MAFFKLKAGIHIQADPDWRPSTKPGSPPIDQQKPPSRTYTAGQTVESDTDLVEKCGEGKFTLMEDFRNRRNRNQGMTGTPGDPVPELLEKNPSVAPAGQVSTGFPSTLGVDTDTPPTPNPVLVLPKNLDQMSVKELQSFAADEEIDLGGSVRKDEILAKIRKAAGPQK